MSSSIDTIIANNQITYSSFIMQHLSAYWNYAGYFKYIVAY
jgi:hypothetical protein